ncbi:MAG: serine/threonine protein kinase, partial [Lachnospiraceae bacterium]|nr:serine/threonine protein kinase [Lachnospiraceae bacterium]
KAWNDENPDRELITLRMYRELVTRSMEYAKYLREDGITKQEIVRVYMEIETDMLQMQKQATENVRQEITAIMELLDGADELLTSSYSGK